MSSLWAGGEKWQQVGAAAKARRVQPFLVVAHYIWCVDRVQDTTGSVMPWLGECSKPVVQEPLRSNAWQPSPRDRKVWRVKCCGCAGCRGILPQARTAWMEVSKGRDPTLNLPLCFNLKRGRVYLGSLDSVTQGCLQAIRCSAWPSRSRAGVLFAAWGDVFVSRHVVQGVALEQIAHTAPKGFSIGRTRDVNPPGLPAQCRWSRRCSWPGRDKRLASVPGALVAVDKLPEPTVALNKKCADTCRPLICW